MVPLTSFAGGTLFGVRHGQGRPWVLALHGWQRSHREFDAVPDGFDAIALDAPRRPPGGFHLTMMHDAEW
jgi:hypothetical protein